MLIDSFLARWSASGDAERANKDSFLNELCDVLGVERPHPKTGDPKRDLYVFEKDVTRTKAGGTSIGRVDPACGTGNFLYVTLDLFKRLETEVLAVLSELGYQQIGLEMERYRVTPEQFLGIEVKRWAKEIAELVLWIGYLQWQVRQPR